MFRSVRVAGCVTTTSNGCAGVPPKRATLSLSLQRRGYAESGSSVRIWKSTTNNCYLNIAAEDWMFREMKADEQTLFLWRNGPTVVIGRNQNPWKECHLQELDKDGVALVRRYSGGGAVYQDLGNFIFTFISPRDDYDKDRNTGIIIRALKNHFNIDASFSGRNDIIVNEKKVSGSAFKLTKDRAFHHGTILLDVNIDNLERYLNVNKEKLKSKGVSSVRSRVLNLVTVNPEISYDSMCEALAKEFCAEYGQTNCPIEELSGEKLLDNPTIEEHYEKLQDWNWRFGETPDFEHNLETRFPWGVFDMYLNSNEGKITNVKIYSDSLYPQLIDEVRDALTNATYDADGVTAALYQARARLEGSGCEECVDDIREWLVKSL